jgi:hypothetical protein
MLPVIRGGEAKPRKKFEIEKEGCRKGGKHKKIRYSMGDEYIDEPAHHRKNDLGADQANSPAGRGRFAGREREGPSGRTGTLSSGPSPKGHHCNPQ